MTPDDLRDFFVASTINRAAAAPSSLTLGLLG
jgi:hypothetical protein